MLALLLAVAVPGFAPVGGVPVDCLENIRGREGRARVEIVVAAGALHEDDRALGVAHMLEHLLLRPLSFDDSNGSTAWDYTSYHRDVPAAELADAATALLRAVRATSFDADAFRLEQLVVVRELGDRGISEKSYDPIFGGTALERSPGGTEATVRALTADDVRAFHARHYVKANVAVLLRGAPSCADLEKALEPELAAFAEGAATGAPVIDASEPGPRTFAGGGGAFAQGFYWFHATDAETLVLRLVIKHLEQRALEELRKERGLTYSPSGSYLRRGSGGQIQLNVSTKGEDRVVSAWYEAAITELRASAKPLEAMRLAKPEVDTLVRVDGPSIGLAAIRGQPSPAEVLTKLDDETVAKILPKVLDAQRRFGTATPQSNLVSLIILGAFGVIVIAAVLFAGSKLVRR